MRQTKRKQSEIVGRFFIYKAKGPNAQGKYHVMEASLSSTS